LIPGVQYLFQGPGGFSVLTASNTATVGFVTTGNAGVFSVTALGTGNCPSSQGFTNVVVNATPATPNAGGNSPLCQGSQLNLTASFIPGATYQWTGPGGFSSTLRNPSITNVSVANSGAYNVVAIVNGCVSQAKTVNIVVNPKPTAPTIGNSGPVCTGTTLNFTASAIPGASYNWTGPNGFSSVAQNPFINSITTNNQGSYTVTATVNGCTSTAVSTTVVVNQSPATPFASSNGPNICQGGSISLAASAVSGATYLWTGPNAFTSGTQNPIINAVTTLNSGTYSVVAMLNNCSSGTATTTVNVIPSPAGLVAGNNGPICPGQMLQLTAATIPGGSYNWTGPNGFGSSLQNPTISNVTTAMAGTYTVTASVSGCSSAQVTTFVSVNANVASPVASSNGPVCEGQTLNLTATTIPGATYNWVGPAGFTSAAQNPTINSVTTANAGIYTVTANVSGCASTSSFVLVNVNPFPAPTIAFSNSPVCVGNNLQLTATFSSGATYLWQGPGGFSSNLQNPTILSVIPGNAGAYSVTVTINGCTSPVTTTSVAVNTIPSTPVASSNAPICAGQNLTLTASSIANATYLWTGPGGFSSNFQNPTIPNVTTVNGGMYNVTATVNGCTSLMGMVNVTINANPGTPTVGSNSPLCAGQTLNLTASTITGALYTWIGPAGFSSTAQNPSVPSTTTVNAGVYTLTVTANGCSTGTQVLTTVVVNALPTTPIVSSNSPVCVGQMVNLSTPAVANAIYSWNGPNNFTSSMQAPMITNATIAAAGVYSVTVMTNGCTSLPGTTNVTVTQVPPTPLASSNSPLCVGQTLNLTSSTLAGASYMWTGPNGFSSAVQNPVITNAQINNTGQYSLTAMLSGCTSTVATVNVTVSAIPVSSIASNNGPLCAGSTLILSAANVANATYMWQGPGGFGATAQTPTIANATTANAGVYSLTTMVNGCSSAVSTTTVTISNQPTILLNSGNTVVCNGQTAFASVTVTGKGPWSINITRNGIPQPPAIFGTTASPSPSTFSVPLAIPATGTFNYIISSVVDGNNCTGVPGFGNFSVIVNPLPTATFTSPNTTICGGTTTTWGLQLTGKGPWVVNYNMNGTAQPPMTVGSATSPSPFNYSMTITPSMTTTYTLTSVTDDNQCTSPASGTFVVNVIPNANFTLVSTNQSICTGQSANFNFTLTGIGPWTVLYTANGIPQSLVVGNAGQTSLTQNLAINPTQTTTYMITNVIGGNNCATTPNAMFTVTVTQSPTVAFTTGNETICLGDMADIGLILTGKGPWTVNYTRNGVAQPAWVVGSANSSSPWTTNMTVSPTPVGGYTYALTSVVDGNTTPCTANAAGSVIIMVTPNPTFVLNSANQTVCEQGTANLNFTLTGVGPWTVQYNLNGFPNTFVVGNSATPSPFTTNIVVTPTATTTYDFTGVIAGNGCDIVVSGTNVVSLNAKPTLALVSGDATVCAGTSTNAVFQLTGKGPWMVDFTANGVPQTPWTVGTATSPNPAVIQFPIMPMTTTTYVITGVKDANNCTSGAVGSFVVTVKPTPTASFIASAAAVCKGQSTDIRFTFTGAGPWNVFYTSNGTTHNLAFGTSASPSPSDFVFSVTPQATTTYTLQSVAGNGCNGTATGSLVIAVEDYPNATVNVPVSICPGESAGLSFNVTDVSATTNWVINYMEGPAPKTISGTGPGLFAAATPALDQSMPIMLVSIVNVSQSLACERTINQTVTAIVNPVPRICSVSTSDVEFEGGVGQISAIASGGSGDGYLYSLDGVNFANTTGFFTVLPGIYSVTVEDANGCRESSPLVKIVDFAVPTIFQKSYGRPNIEMASDVTQALDGGYVGVGYTRSVGAGNDDAVLMKTDSEGNAEWVRTFGGTNAERAQSVAATEEGGYALAGYTRTFGFSGSEDFYLIKTDDQGIETWRKTYGGVGNDQARSLMQTSDGGYVMAGYTESAGNRDFYLVKTDAMGNMMWSKTFGGTGIDEGWQVRETCDGGYIVVGQTTSQSGNNDVYVVKTNDMGNMMWDKVYSTVNNEIGYSITQTPDGGYMVSGTATVAGGGDFFLLKLFENGNVEFSSRYGTNVNDQVRKAVRTNDGYVVSGYRQVSSTNRAGYITKTDINGNVQWSRIYTGSPFTNFETAMVTGDKGIIAIGASLDAGNWDNYLVKTSENGMTNNCREAVVTTTRNSYIMNAITPSFMPNPFTPVEAIPTHIANTTTFTATEICSKFPSAMISAPANTITCIGVPAALRIDLTGQAPWTIQYSQNGGPATLVTGIMAATYSLTVTPTVSGLVTYTLTSVTDASGNVPGTVSGSAVITVNTAQGSALIANQIGGTPTICIGQSTMFGINFTGPAPYSIRYRENGGTPITVTGITANPYMLTVTPTGSGVRTYTLTEFASANGCWGTSVSGAALINVNPQSSSTATISGTPPAICLNDIAVFTVTLTGGPAPWSIKYSENGGTPMSITGITASPYSLTVTPTGLGVRTYTLTEVKDANNCGMGLAGGLATVNVQGASTASASISGTSGTRCFGASAAFNVALTGTAPWTLTYRENNGPQQTVTNIASSPFVLTVTPTGTGVRTYTLTSITDGVGCTNFVNLSGSVTVNVIAPPTAAFSASSASTCLGLPAVLPIDLTGGGPWSITYNENGGSPISVSNITASPFNLTVTPTAVGTRTYNLTSVSNSGVCGGGTVSGSATVTVAAGINVTVGNIGAASCTGTEGSITVSATGGTGNFVYSLDGVNFNNTTGVFNNLAGGTYTVSVKSGSCVTTQSVFVPSSIAPSVTVGSPTFSTIPISWNAVTGAVSYNVRYRIANSQTFSTISGVQSTSVVISPVQSNSTYEIQVQAVCANGQASAFSNPVTASTPVNPGTASCQLPGNLAATVTGTSQVTISWSANVSNAVCYLVSYGPISVDPINWNTVLVPHPGTSFQISTGLTPGTTYGVRIRTNCSLCSTNSGVRSSFPSQTVQFTTSASKDGEETVADAFAAKQGLTQFRVYPNPNKGLFTVSFEAAEDMTSNLRVLDMNGREVYNKDFNAVVGANEISVDISNYSAGIYLLQYNDGQNVRTAKVVVN